MKMGRFVFVVLLSALFVLPLAGCGDDEGGSVDPDTGWFLDTTVTDGPVSIVDSGTGDATTQSDAVSVGDSSSADAGAVTLAGQVQPIFTSRCALSSCHRGGKPAAGLNLNSGNSYQDLVDVGSVQCPSLVRIKPGSLSDSYLVQKIEGAGSCFTGVKMPVNGSLQPGEISTIKTWITGGALEH